MKLSLPSLAVVVVLAGITFYAGLVVVSNRMWPRTPVKEYTVANGDSVREAAPEELVVTTWNIGYAGMGRESDFVADGGSQKRPLSKEIVRKNVSAIADSITAMDSDVLLIQEMSNAGYNTRGVEVREELLRSGLEQWSYFYAPDTKTRWMPPGLRVNAGTATFSRYRLNDPAGTLLEHEPGFMFGIFRRDYRASFSQLKIDGRAEHWAIANVHLAAFDNDADVRKEQLRQVLELAAEEYRRGNPVVVGGDWNLVLAATEFPHTTDDKYLFWVHDFPREIIPEGWRMVSDPSTPTVRTAHKPYVAGENYVTIIDGFLVSPNVEAVDVSTADLGFEASDHNPVTAVFHFKPGS